MDKVTTVLYYKAIRRLCFSCGAIVKHEALLNDLRSYSPSPDSYRVLVNKHESSLEVLEEKVNKAKKKRAKIGRVVSKLAKKLELYPANEDMRENEDAIDFCDKLMYREEDCDFRKKVLDYSKQQLDHIAAGKEMKPMDFAAFLERYDKLVNRRLNCKKKKK